GGEVPRDRRVLEGRGVRLVRVVAAVVVVVDEPVVVPPRVRPVQGEGHVVPLVDEQGRSRVVQGGVRRAPPVVHAREQGERGAPRRHGGRAQEADREAEDYAGDE